MTQVLLLGGTSDASALARALARAGVPATFSYAGATQTPLAQPLPTRVGGFGGVEGLLAYIRARGITHVVDATHPFAAQMSRNACAACAASGTPLLALERPPWQAQAGDAWIDVPDMAAAAAALPAQPARVFLAIGRQQLGAFAGLPQHHYLLRVVDAATAQNLPLPQASVEVGRGPFSAAHDEALLRRHRIGWVVCKNAGGEATRGKLLAARALGLPVVMVRRPALPGPEQGRPITAAVADVLHWLRHGALPGKGTLEGCAADGDVSGKGGAAPSSSA